jgi:hypothetical protein
MSVLDKSIYNQLDEERCSCQCNSDSEDEEHTLQVADIETFNYVLVQYLVRQYCVSLISIIR